MKPYQLDRLIRKIRCSFDLGDCLEFTVEAGRPDSITEEKLLVLRKNGISRISINPQTMKQKTLDLIRTSSYGRTDDRKVFAWQEKNWDLTISTWI